MRGGSGKDQLYLGTDFTGATLSGCHVYGMSSWDAQLDGTQQHDLCITPERLP